MLNPDGELQIIDYSNSPFARPDLRILVEGDNPHRETDILTTCQLILDGCSWDHKNHAAYIDYSNSPFARPDLRILVEGAPRAAHTERRRQQPHVAVCMPSFPSTCHSAQDLCKLLRTACTGRLTAIYLSF